ncbi:MAG: glycosyltransferase family 2 protein [SAR324 cluster bacterium]|nr:glycosyltransferase family 2 protein [SAR324 cluster bacterium]
MTANQNNPILAVIIPVYNEEGSIAKVIEEWTKELLALKIHFQIHVYNDGSKDKTLEILNQLNASNPHLVVHDKPNSGHGSTILLGYRENSDATWVFQVDSDDEMGPESFRALWVHRDQYRFMIGRRYGREQPISRKFVSFVSRILVFLLYGRSIYDVNCPYRLMKSDVFKSCFSSIPSNTFAPNVLIAGYAAHHKMKIVELDVPFRSRQTGAVSIYKLKLLKVASLSFLQTILYRGKI